MNWNDSILKFVIEKSGHKVFADLCDEKNAHHLVWRQRVIQEAINLGYPGSLDGNHQRQPRSPMVAVAAPGGSVVAAPAEYPSLARQAGNLVAAAGRVVSAAVQGKDVLVSPDIFRERLAICKDCVQFDAHQDRCRLCGCYTMKKLNLATESCPLDPPLWTAHKSP